MPKIQNRTRLKFLEYKLLEAIKNGANLDTQKETISGLDGKPIPSLMDVANTLIERSFITEKDYLLTEKGITSSGILYLYTHPVPKIKHPKLFDMTSADVEYLKLLQSSKFEWTRAVHLAKRSSMLFKLVRFGYAVARKSGDKSKILKNEILPKPSLTIPENRSRYSFKITKKGLEYLLSIK
jgi:hypothetical protein